MNTGISAINAEVQQAAILSGPCSMRSIKWSGQKVFGRTARDRPAGQRPRLARRRAGLAKTLSVKNSGGVSERQICPPPVHPRHAASGCYRHANLQPQSGNFSTRRGPIFAHLVLADEINRAPAKVKSALLEAMQEKQVPLAITPLSWRNPSWCWLPKIPSNRKALTRAGSAGRPSSC